MTHQDPADDDFDPTDLGPCEWFLLCDRPAVMLLPHPVLGAVPTCERCAERVRKADQ